MAKKSTRKHKKWEDDGILEITGKSGILKVICTKLTRLILYQLNNWKL